MPDLNVMMLEQARIGIQTELDAAVTNGDTEAARKAAEKLSNLNVATAPKSMAYGQDEIRSALEAKADWFGIDPRKSGAAVRLGKDMNLKKFATAEAFADALIKAVNEEFKPAAAESAENEDDEGEGAAENEDGEGEEKPKPKTKRTDGPGEGDTASAVRTRKSSGPWIKISDAPADVQKEIKRTADKFAPKTKEGREDYVTRALEAHYNKAQLAKGKK